MFFNSISSVSFRIYINRVGWELLTVLKKPTDVVKAVEHNYPALIVVHDFDMDADTNVYSVLSEEDFLYFKQELLNLPQDMPKNTKKLVKNHQNARNIDKNS